MLGEEAAGERSEDGGEESGEFDDAVAPAEFGVGEEFGEERVFCWAEDCALGAGEEEGEAGEVDAIVGEREGGERHDDEFENFHAEGDAALAVFVGEVAAGDREDEEGNGEEERDDEDEPEVALIFVGEGFEDEEADEPFEGVVAEGVLKLDGDEQPRSRRWLRGGGAVGDAELARLGAAVRRGGICRCGHGLRECSRRNAKRARRRREMA